MSAHTNVQRRLADALTAALGDTYIVRGYAWAPDGKQPDRRFVAIFRTEISRTVPESSQALPDGTLGHVLTVEVLSAHEDMERAEDDLYAGTDEVLAVIDHDPGLRGYTWTSATRDVIGDEDAQFHIMRISAWCLTTEEQE